MKIKTSEATGLQLDWGLAVALDLTPVIHQTKTVHALTGKHYDARYYQEFDHTDPAVCMGLIEQHGIASTRKTFSLGHFWECKVLDAGSESHYIVAHGKTLAEAVARCVISMKLGETFDVPDELGVQS